MNSCDIEAEVMSAVRSKVRSIADDLAYTLKAAMKYEADIAYEEIVRNKYQKGNLAGFTGINSAVFDEDDSECDVTIDESENSMNIECSYIPGKKCDWFSDAEKEEYANTVRGNSVRRFNMTR